MTAVERAMVVDTAAMDLWIAIAYHCPTSVADALVARVRALGAEAVEAIRVAGK
jgi:hypothetical protein